jgi:hypothetical protein
MFQRKHVYRGLAAAFALICLFSAGAMWNKPYPLPYTVLLGLIFCSGMLALWFGRKADAE